ncbi:hypothetical protein EDC01DRAFT_778922 [Geopyxis carbonaria]|nr:hypothetical protein EDC01DRAFT_778922 [Geopyxis carbonaria]
MSAPPAALLDSVSPTPELSETSATSDPLATGIKALLDPTVRLTTDKLSAVYLAQQELSGELERLVSQLQRYLDTTDPPSLRGTVVKLAGTTKRLAAVNGEWSE